jgi:hypothetical protein
MPIAPAEDRRPMKLAHDEGGKLHAVWSRSGKRLIITVDRRQQHAQVDLRPDQVAQLGHYLAEQPHDGRPYKFRLVDATPGVMDLTPINTRRALAT